MELTEDKVKSLLDGQNLNKLNDDIFDQLINIAVSHACGKFDGTGMQLDFNVFILSFLLS
jgi:hypothetical protein